MAQKASQAELNRFVKVVDDFKAKFARLIAPATKAEVYATGNRKMISDYDTAVIRGRALNTSINALVGAWNAFKRGYKKVTDTTSTYIGDAVDEIRSWFGYDPSGGLGYMRPLFNEDTLTQQRPLDVDADLYGASYSGLNGLGAVPLAAIPAAVAVAGVISAALILNSLMDKIFVTLEANRIQKQNPNISRPNALAQAKNSLPSLLPGGISLPMIAAGGIALYFILGNRK